METRTLDQLKPERGQTLVIVALVFVGLVALAGLAVDGGNLFVQRRQAQNAADAAAIAGTRLVAEAIQTCDPIDLAALDTEIKITINEYAETNDIADTNGIPGDAVNDNVVAYYVGEGGLSLAPVVGDGTGTVPVGTSGIRVEVEDLDETYFIQVAGIDEIPSSATAMALVGVINQLPPGAGLIPVAVPLVAVQALEPGDEWKVLDTTNPKNEDEGRFCSPDGTVCAEDPDASLNSQRGWLNLNHIFNKAYLDSGDSLNRTFDRNVSNDGCPSDPTKKLPGLAGYASGLCPYQHAIFAGEENKIDGDFIHGDPGSRAASVQEINTNLVGDIAYAPIFDRIYLTEEMIGLFDPQAESPEGYSNGGGFSSSGGGVDNTYYYHVVGFTAFRVGAPQKGSEKNQVVRGTFEAAVVQGGMTVADFAGAGGCSSLVHGVMQWE